MNHSLSTRALGALLLSLFLVTETKAQDMKRVNLDQYGFNFSIELPKDAEIMDNQTGLSKDGTPVGEHILAVSIRKNGGLSDMYIKATNMSLEELKSLKKQAYIAKNMTGVVLEGEQEIIYEYKKDKKYYQVCGIVEINGKVYMYTSNDSYTKYSMKQVKLLSKIAQSVEI